MYTKQCLETANIVHFKFKEYRVKHITTVTFFSRPLLEGHCHVMVDWLYILPELLPRKVINLKSKLCNVR